MCGYCVLLKDTIGSNCKRFVIWFYMWFSFSMAALCFSLALVLLFAFFSCLLFDGAVTCFYSIVCIRWYSMFSFVRNISKLLLAVAVTIATATAPSFDYNNNCRWQWHWHNMLWTVHMFLCLLFLVSCEKLEVK